jgi:hypothetical protein
VADLRITGRDLERWLAIADGEKEKKDDAASARPPETHKQ